MVFSPFLTDFFPKKGYLKFSGGFFLGEIFEKLTVDPYNFGSEGFQLGNPNRRKIFKGIKNMPISTV